MKRFVSSPFGANVNQAPNQYSVAPTFGAKTEKMDAENAGNNKRRPDTPTLTKKTKAMTHAVPGTPQSRHLLVNEWKEKFMYAKKSFSSKRKPMII